MRRFRERTWWALVAAITVILVFVAATPAGAQTKGEEVAAALGIQLNLLWVILGAILVMFMQAGFALVETGFCRAKHAGSD